MRSRLFPLLLIPPDKKSADSPKAGDASLAARIRRAEALEFVDEEFPRRRRSLSGALRPWPRAETFRPRC